MMKMKLQKQLAVFKQRRPCSRDAPMYGLELEQPARNDSEIHPSTFVYCTRKSKANQKNERSSSRQRANPRMIEAEKISNMTVMMRSTQVSPRSQGKHMPVRRMWRLVRCLIAFSLLGISRRR